MKVSVVTASLNQGRFIRACLESVKKQVLAETVDKGLSVEHIVVDGGSTDETVLILQEWEKNEGQSDTEKARGESRYHFRYVSEPDKGMSDGINKGGRMATGEWWMWLNSDDCLLPGALEKLTNFIQKHPQLDMVYGAWNFMNAKGEVQKSVKTFPFDLNMLIYHGCYIGSTAAFYRKATTLDAGYYLNEEFRNVMDMEYYVRLGKAGKNIKSMPDLLAQFRIHESNTSMHLLGSKDLSGLLKRQKQIAEGVAIRRFYGWTLFHEPFADGIVDGLLWYFYTAKKILIKLVLRAY
jgi:glycosyltransferase involved in cell wall biosynthesis